MFNGFWEHTYNITDGTITNIRIASFGDTALHLVALQAICTVADASATFSVNVIDDDGLQYGGPSSDISVVGEHAEAVIPVSGGISINVVNTGSAGQWKLKIAYL